MNRSQIVAIAVATLLVVVPGTAVAMSADQKVTPQQNTDTVQLEDQASSGSGDSQNVTGNPNINVFFPENQVAPGTTTVLNVHLVNDGNVTNGSVTNPELERQVTSARSLRVRLEGANVSAGDMTGEFAVRDGEIVPVRSREAMISVSTNERAAATFPDEASTQLPFEVTVDKNTDPGRYTLPLNVTYNYTQAVDPSTGEENHTIAKKTYNVTLVVEDTALFRVTDVDSKARVGATGTVTVTVQNVGSEVARDARVRLASQNSDLTFGQTATSSRVADGNWVPGENRTLSYRVQTASTASPQRYAFARLPP